MRAILLTIKYFDLFDYALEKAELWQWLFQLSNKAQEGNKIISRQEFDNKLEQLAKLNKLEQKGEYYFLPGRDGIIKLRQRRYKISLKKIRKAQKIAALLSLIPGLKMISLVSNLGFLNADEEADIDFFIVTQKGKIWSVRFWSVVLMMLLGQRPKQHKTKNKICLSYFIDEQNLNLEKTKVAEIDIHLIYLLSQNLPIYDEDAYWLKFVAANSWTNQYLPNFSFTSITERFIIKPKCVWLKKMISRTSFSFEEELYKKIQMNKMAPQLRKMMNRGDNKVIINDSMLKLHINDKRQEVNGILDKLILNV